MLRIIKRGAIPALQVLLFMIVAPFAAAYIGPGSGISVIGSLLALLATIGIAFLAIIMFPFRRMMKKKRGMDADTEDSDEEPSAEDALAAKESAETP